MVGVVHQHGLLACVVGSTYYVDQVLVATVGGGLARLLQLVLQGLLNGVLLLLLLRGGCCGGGVVTQSQGVGVAAAGGDHWLGGVVGGNTLLHLQ